MIEKPVKNVDGLARIGVHGNDVESAVLVGGEAVAFGAGVGAVPRVEIADRLGMPSRRKILASFSGCGYNSSWHYLVPTP